MLRVIEALDACRLKPVPCDGYVDNDALRLAVGRGSSAKLGHLHVHADTCFRFLAQLPISLHRVSTTECEADITTKVLSAVRHRELCKTDFDHASVMAPRMMAKSGSTRRSLLVFVCYSGAAERAGLCMKVGTESAHDGFRK